MENPINLILNSETIFQEYNIEFEDVTDILDSLALSLINDPSQVALAPGFKLKECSSDIEVLDERTDIRCDPQFTQPDQTLKKAGLPTPKSTPLDTVISIYDEVFLREGAWFFGKGLIHNFYDFTLFHSEALVKENPLIHKLVAYSHSAMKKIY
jgi:Mak10 subunit, NatC N(alpha)-terminal acetyltransferase